MKFNNPKLIAKILKVIRLYKNKINNSNRNKIK